ncbi:unnamed protein product [Arctia plantaginis]|uniref:Sucrose-6-phosphate hydrolase n=1 Tax=Arctia plantaginis TaxID=874455 RepID=A0A8S0YR15_ARCPL|nr:unnamed protein product [Arctia plantaginis]
MNDPNGFCVFKNEFHLFYQYNPLSSQEPGIAHWGHAKSSDLFHWEHLEIALYPDKNYDKTGVFSGSAIIVNETMNLLYTGNSNNQGEIQQRQALASSTNGVKFIKYPENPVLLGNDYQPNIRDPKVWQYGDDFYMVIGNSFKNDTLGRVLLFSSKDLKSWKEASILGESDGFLGYMWECPDFFELNGKFVLLFSPQGVKPQGDQYKNLYQSGYIVGDFDYKSKVFTPITKFKELDYGHDFYATQTIIDSQKRRIVVAWLSMWEQVYPERNDGWSGQLTIPRALQLTSTYELIQKPVDEILDIRNGLLYSGIAPPGTSIKLHNNIGEIVITASQHEDFNLIFEAGNTTVTLKYDNNNGKVSLDRGGNDGVRRTDWRPLGRLQMRIFVDRSSIEVFCGDGEVTFSSRFFPYGEVNVRLGEKSKAENMLVYHLKRTVPAP